MASIAHFKEVLKEGLLQKKGFISEYLSAQELTQAAVATEYRWRNRVWTPVQTIWTFLIQVLHADWSCREAVGAVLAEQAAAGVVPAVSQDPTAYCQGRKRLPLSLFDHASKRVAGTLEAQVGDAYRWCGRRVRLIDGSSCSMPDTPELQAEFGQPSGQKSGCGFPVARLVAMFCWASGVVLDVAIGAYRRSELTLVRSLWDHLKRGDIVLADRFYCTYVVLSELLTRGCDAVFRLHGARSRTMDFRRGKRLGRQDRLMTWKRPQVCPRGLSHPQWMALPERLTIRVLRFSTRVPGYRSRTILIATTLLDPVTYPAEAIAALYGDRWTVELRLRDIKTTMQMDILRGQSPDVVRKEIYMHLLAYNLIRALMWQAAQAHGRPLHRLSFAGTVEHLNDMLPYLWLYAGTRRARSCHDLLLEWIARDRLPDRPGRIEPRAVKRRPKEYDLLNRPRPQLRQALLRKTG
jgi:hypothetical protein